jgi:cytochrome o ubiquinol oxidase operon protein cyoD
MLDEEVYGRVKDRPPGETEQPDSRLGAYGLGAALSVVLTLASFWSASTHLVYGPSVPILLAVLAVAQMGVHLVFFLHVSSAPDQINNFLALAFGVLVVGLNLNHAMIPMEKLMQMQR